MKGSINYDETIKHGFNALIKIMDTRVNERARKLSSGEYNHLKQELAQLRDVAANPKNMLKNMTTVYRYGSMDVATYSGHAPINLSGVNMVDSFAIYAYDYYHKTGYIQQTARKNILQLNKIFQLHSATGMLNKITNHFLDFASPKRFAVRDTIQR